MDDFRKLVKRNRSCRRFDNTVKIENATLKELVDLARMSASAANLQPLKYILSSSPDKNSEIFSCLAWAAYLKDWQGPVPEERPAGYIIILGDTRITANFRCDHGIAAQSILLGARDKELAGCIFAAINHNRLKNRLEIADHLEILLVIALGKPAEEIRLEALEESGDIKYWRDSNDVHHVPKRRLDDIIVSLY